MAAKEARIRRASIQQASTNAGVDGSSGELGALAALSNSMAGQIGQQKSNILAISGINRNLQSAADHRARAERIGIYTGVIQSGIQLGMDEGIFTKPAGS